MYPDYFWALIILCLPQKSDVLIPSQPVALGRSISIGDIAFFILEWPWRDDNHITFADPGTALHLSFNPAKTGHSIRTADAYVKRAKHELSICKLFPLPAIRQTNPDGFHIWFFFLFNCWYIVWLNIWFCDLIISGKKCKKLLKTLSGVLYKFRAINSH